jgi:uncharacterized protein YdhG (YjbR/CyaY superfamily)
MKTTPATTDERLAALPPDQKEVLKKPRMTIRAAAPSAQESISSGIPTFKHGRRYLVSFGAAEQHVAFYVMRGSAHEAQENDLEECDTSNTVIRFAPNNPLPASLVRSIVEIHLGEIEAQTTHSAPVADRPGRKQGSFPPG